MEQSYQKQSSVRICPKTGQPVERPRLTGWAKWLFPLVGAVSLLWFLIRVLPKPSRALYPCQRAAAPLASSFVIWLLGMSGCALAFRNARQKMRTARFALAGVLLIGGVLAGIMAVTGSPIGKAVAGGTIPPCYQPLWYPRDAANSPMGVAQGIHPGRVAWVQDFTATSGDISWDASIDGSNPGGYYWDEAHCHQAVVNDMMSKAVRWMTGEPTDVAAWDTIFRYFNRAHGKGDIGYQPGEKIAIKINSSSAYIANFPGYSSDPARWYNMTNPDDPANLAIYHLFNNESNPTPQAIVALLHQLVDVAGVPQEDIYIGDPIRFFIDPLYTRCHAAYPNVHYMDPLGKAGREKATVTSFPVLFYSGHPETNDQLAQFIYNADYFINMALLKRSGPIGGTFCGKNNFGSMGQTPEHIHDFLHGPAGWATGMGTYNGQVDHLGNRYLGGKTLLYMLDGLFAGWWSNTSWSMPVKWNSLGGKWPSSVFLSQDPVAIDSVGLDMLHSETNEIADCADNYLHEAALANAPPSGTFYDPNNTGTRLSSLGVHEHWNNNTEKKYSRNLGTGAGIELISSQPPLTPDGPPTIAPIADQTLYMNGPSQTLSLGIAPYDADDTVSVSAVADHPELVMATMVSNTTLMLTPVPGACGAATITVSAQGDEPGSPAATRSFTVTIVPSTPVASDDSYSCLGSQPFVVAQPGVLGNDTDPAARRLSAVLVADPDHGEVNLHADGSFTYTPDAGYSGPDRFTYQAKTGTDVSNVATVSLFVRSPRCIDLAADIDFNVMTRYNTDSSRWMSDNFSRIVAPPASWTATPGQGNFFDLFCWYGWGVYTDTTPHSFNMMSTTFDLGYWGQPTTTEPLTVQRSLPSLGAITGWGLTTKMFVNNVVNATLPANHVSADPRIAFEDAAGNPIANLEWRVTDNVDPNLTTNQVLLNGSAVVPTTFGTLTPSWSIFSAARGANTVLAGYDPAIADYADHTNKSFDLVLASGADGHTLARLNSGGPSGTVVVPTLGGADAAHPARLAFYCGNGMNPMGGGNFQFYYQPGGTMNFYYTHALPVDDTYLVNQNEALTTMASVLDNDQNPDNTALRAELATPPAHGAVTLNADGTFTYTPAAGYAGPDSFTYHLVDGAAITSAATVHLQVRAQSLVQVGTAINLNSSTIQVPIELLAQGDENTLSFSLNFDPSLLTNPVVALGADTPDGSLLLVNSSGAAAGSLGMGIALPAGMTFAPGTRQVAVITFTVTHQPGVMATALTFTDYPTECALSDALAQALGATWQNGMVLLNHPPTAQDDAYAVNRNATLMITQPGVLSNDTDPDGDPLTAVLVTSPLHGTLRLHADGSFSYTPVHNYVGPDSFTYQASDGIELANLATVTLTVLSTGYEADVAARPDGDGKVSMTDWVQVGRFVAGLDLTNSPSEFQRADCAPRTTLGDGHLSIIDWVQAGRYAMSLDPLTPVGGPTAPGATGAARFQAAGKTPVLRTVSLAPATLTLGKPGAVQVVLTAQGNESALGFTLNYNPKQMKFLGAKLVGMASNATLNVNTAQAASGHVGLALMLPLPQTVKAGKQALVELVFQPLAFGPAQLTFGDQLIGREVAGNTATALPATFVNGTVMVRK